MSKLIGHAPFHGLKFTGTRFDCGDKVGFLEAQIALAWRGPISAGDGPGILEEIREFMTWWRPR